MTELLLATQLLAHLLGGETVEGDIRWDEVVGLAQRYRCAAGLYLQLKSSGERSAVPEPVWETLRRAHLAAIALDAQREAELARVFAGLQAGQIPALVLKGTALAYQVYAASWLRMTGDLDILVRPADVGRVRVVLEDLGYSFEPEPVQRINPFNAGFTGEIAMRRAAGAAEYVVEIHWEIIISDVFKRLSRLPVDDFWRRATTIRVGGIQVQVLSREDALLHTCVHLALHGFTHLIGYLDVLQLARQPLDWDQFVACAAASRTRVACYFSLWWAQQAWQAAIPDSVLSRLRPGPVHAALGRRLVQRGVRMGALPGGHAWEHLAQFVLADHAGDWLRVLAWLFFPGPGWLRERYHLRSRWQALAWVLVHPWIVLAEGGRNLLTLIKHR